MPTLLTPAPIIRSAAIIHIGNLTPASQTHASRHERTFGRRRSDWANICAASWNGNSMMTVNRSTLPGSELSTSSTLASDRPVPLVSRA
jgi:hypothetical protein